METGEALSNTSKTTDSFVDSTRSSFNPFFKESDKTSIKLPCGTRIPVVYSCDVHWLILKTIPKTMKKFNLLLIITAFTFVGLKAQENTTNSTYHPDFKAVYWFQHSAEMQALYHQAYNLALYRLEQISATPSTKKRAVILDLDETVLDNSPYQAFVIDKKVLFPTGWSDWTNLANAEALPGVIHFLNEAKKLGIEPIYISNRKDAEKGKTIENLKKLGIPNATEAFVITRSQESDKTNRRAQVAQDYDIVMLIGDNLGDFDEVFQSKANSLRKAEVEKHKAEFGKKFIIIPNPMYGEWEGAGFGFEWSSPLFKRYNQMKDSLKVADM